MLASRSKVERYSYLSSDREPIWCILICAFKLQLHKASRVIRNEQFELKLSLVPVKQTSVELKETTSNLLDICLLRLSDLIRWPH